MDYQKIYDKLIETRKNRIMLEGVYYEKHHIVMRSMGGNNRKENLVNLTPKEHFVAHRLLYMIYKNLPTSYALWRMCHNGSNKKEHFKPNSRLYAEIRESIIKKMTGVKHSLARRAKVALSKIGNKYRLGKKHTEETKRKISIKKKGVSYNIGHVFSEESKQKMRLAKLGKEPWNKGKTGLKKASDETKAKMRVSQKERWNKRKQSNQ